MTTDIAALEAQHAQLTAKLAAAKTEAKAGAIAEVKATMAEHGLTVADVCGTLSAVKSSAGTGKKTGPVAVKYRNAATGDTWTGRGQTPNWLKAEFAKGMSRDDFKIAA